jgi:hypothetical protein
MPMIDVYAAAGTFGDTQALARNLATELMAIEEQVLAQQLIESFNSRVRDDCLNLNNVLVTGSGAGGDKRLEGGLQPPPATLRARLPGAGCLRCSPHPSMIDSH